MIELMPLAHGAVGYLDELLPVLIVGIPAVLLGAAMFIARKREDEPAGNQSADSMPTGSQPDSKQAGPDHFRLD